MVITGGKWTDPKGDLSHIEAAKNGKTYALTGQVTKNIYQLGDEVMVQVKNTDLERKHLDFNLIE